jgi:hypothetical protein
MSKTEMRKLKQGTFGAVKSEYQLLIKLQLIHFSISPDD